MDLLMPQQNVDLHYFYNQFRHDLGDVKKNNVPEDFSWYGYEILANVLHIEGLLGKNWNGLLNRIDGPVADIGTADGDLGFLLEKLGHTVDLIDYAPTNWNGMRGARRLKELMASNVGIHEVDLDSQFIMPREHYGLVLFLGILYHLKNPYYALERIARSSKYCLVSTRIASHTTDGTKISHLPVAYLLAPDECHNDATNYWIFSEAGLHRVFERAGWNVEAFRSVGCKSKSNPSDPDRDERAFALLRSRYFE
jgi:tRNA (mo5U34)-methyltransferase